jgi:predicted O-linked N-acetylglucosamine transferase (SPINDLY family)/ADP-heptose:LPS heptosyltransferase
MQQANFQQALQYHQQGQLDQAEALYQAVLQQQADHIDALHFSGVLAHQRGQEQRAIELISRALELAPNNAAAHSNLGLAQHALQQYQAALASYNRALAINPSNADALFNRGHTLDKLKRANEAIASYEQALAIKPDLEFIFGACLYLKMNLCQWDDFAKHLNTLIDGIKQGKKIVVPFSLLTMSSSLAIQKQAAEIYSQAKHPNAVQSQAAKHAHKKIKIGYFSSDFRQHPVAYLIAELIERHDRSRFEIIAFSFHATEQKDALRLRLESAFDQFIDVSTQSDEQIVQLARDMEIDIAIDLNGCTDGCRTDIFAMRAAPIQATYLGYSGTLGADYMDYIIADSVLIPSQYQAYYTEKVVYLPNSYMVRDTTLPISDKTMSRAEHGLPEQGMVFCCFNNHYKITPAVFTTWMHILHQVPNSVLWLSFASDEVINNLCQHANRLGITSERLIFAPRLASSAEHLARHRLADLFLDTTPYNAHTTSNDALWAGLPVLTCTGEAAASRVAASLLSAIGLPELITNNLTDYQALAIQLANHPEQIAALKQKLAANRLTHPLFDTALFTQHIEQAYQAMFERYQVDLAPEHILVGDVQSTNTVDVPQNPDSFLQAVALHQQGQLEQAEVLYKKTLQAQPQHADALHLLGVIAKQRGQHQLAIDLISQALQINPNHAAAHSNIALAYQALDNYDQALTHYNHALMIQPDYAEALFNRGITLQCLKRLQEAADSYARALALQANNAEAAFNRGVALQDSGLLNEAIAGFDQAIAIKPDYINAHWNKSLCYLLQGDFANGWHGYEWREQLRDYHRVFEQPVWHGQQPLQGKTILLHVEQGLGDTLQFCRYVPLVKALGATVILEVQPALKQLLTSLQDVDVLLQEGETLPDFDYHCPLLSLPLAFNTVLNSIPSNVPYLSSQAERVQKWQSILGEKTLPRIGVVWSGSSLYLNDPSRYRAIPLSQFSQLFTQSAQFISLQKELRDDEAELLASFSNVQHFGAQLQDFADTAALCELMDVIITVDTSVAHLAGAMGKSMCIFLPYIPDWRWLLERDDCPWYPSARLFRQTAIGDWQTVLDAYQAISSVGRVSDSISRQANSISDDKFNQAFNLHKQGQLTEATQLYEAALQNNPQHIDALHFFGVLKHQQKQSEQAVELIRRALEIDNNNAAAHSNLGLALHALQQYDEAIDSYNHALQLKPDNAEAYYNRGNAFLALKRFEDALADYDKALSIHPAYIEALSNRGMTLRESRRFDEALANYQHIITILPNSAEALVGCAIIHQELKQYNEAISYYDRALAANSDLDFMLGNRLQMKMTACAWQDFNQQVHELEQRIAQGKKAAIPFTVQAVSYSAALQKQAAHSYNQERHPAALLLPLPLKHRHEKIKIGYFSSDFCHHPVAYLTAELFERHDRTRFEIIAFSFHRSAQKDDMRLRLETAFDKFIDVCQYTDKQIVQLARELEIDIAVDLNGCTEGCRTSVFAMRAAPIQVQYIGYLGTMGMDYYDYLLADETLVPKDQQPHYCEKIAYLPNSFQTNDSTQAISDKVYSRAEQHLPEQGVIFCCFNNHYKITPDVFAAWMRILQQVPHSVLWLLAGNSVTECNLRASATAQGIEATRLIFAQRLPMFNHLARHRLADLFLDTSPYNAGATASAALWAGLPVLSYLGSTYSSRMAASLLYAIGLPELVTGNLAEYETLAVQLANHPEQLAAVKQKLSDNRLAYPLFDTALFTQHLENIYQQMFARYQADLAPEHIYVADKVGDVHPTAVGRVSDSVTRQNIDTFQQAFNLHKQGQLTAATQHYEVALQNNPQHIDALHFFGVLKHQQGQAQQAVDLISRALELNADNAAAHANLGLALYALNDFDKAISCYDRALTLQPEQAETLSNRGNALQALQRYDEALANYEQALTINPHCVNALYNRGIALQVQHRFKQALDSYAQVLAIQPDYEFLFGTWLHLKMNVCDWQNFEQHLNDLASNIAAGKKTSIPFTVLALPLSSALQKQAAEIYVKAKHPSALLAPAPSKHSHTKIKIAYFSGDFGQHPISYLMAELFERHDRARFEVFAFSFTPARDKDALRTRLEAAFDQFIDVSDKTDSEVVQLARALEIDIAIDLQGFNHGRRTDIFAMRAAPIQASYLGYLGTMGADYIDYLIADEILIPKAQQADYAEKIVYLPNSFQVNDSTQAISDKVFTRKEQGLPEQGIVFCCFNNHYKITPDVFAIWMQILQQVPDSVLWLLGGNAEAEHNLRASATAQGIAATRLIFAQRLPMEENLARHCLADLFLDTNPYNAGATASSALWAGLPVLTYLGNSFASRMAASLLTAIGLPELVTGNLAEYETLAVQLANNPEQLAAVKQKLAANRLSYPLFDTALFTKHIEDAYQQMFARYQADLAPEHIYVGDAQAITAVGRVSDSVSRQTNTVSNDTFNQAMQFHQQGQLAEAMLVYQAILQNNPQHADALHFLGVLHHQQGDNQSALELIKQSLTIRPNNASAYINLATVLQALSRIEEAIDSYDHALRIQPDDANTLFMRGNLFLALQRFAEALVNYDSCLMIQADNLEALSNRGVALQNLNRWDEALISYDRALAIKPDYAPALTNRGNVLKSLKRFEDALASYDMALAINPNDVDTLTNRGNIQLLELKRLDDAIDSYNHALSIEPDYNLLFGTWLFLKMRMCDWHNFEQHISQFNQKVAQKKQVVDPFSVLAISPSIAVQNKIITTYAQEKYPSHFLAPQFIKHKHQKIKIGYFSADFYQHATAYLMVELFERHDRSRFEIIAFAFNPTGHEDDMRFRLESLFDQFIDVSLQSDTEVVQLARELEIDIAVDLKGYTDYCRTNIFAMRVAPVQVNYLGYPSTMGVDYIDYLIADSTLIPAEYQRYYTEKIVYLPNSYQVNDRNRIIADRIFSRIELGLPEHGFVFCCFNNNFKITPALFDVWMRLLHSVEGSVLWLLADNDSVACNLCMEAKVRGISAERLIFAPRMALPEHLARHRLADLFLDTLIYNAHTTTSDALWAGLPVLTCMGETFASRVAASLLNAVGLSELITDNLADYEALALQLANHPDQLEAVKQKLADNRLNYPLFDTALFTKHIEDAYQQMFARYQADLAPDHIYVGDAQATTTVARVSDSVTRQIAETPLNNSENQQTADEFFNQANNLLATQQFIAAIENYNEALAIQPDYAEALSNRAIAWQYLGDLKEALLSYDKAIAIKPNYVDALYNRGTLLRAMGRFEEAILSYQQALAIEPDYAFLFGTWLYMKMTLCDWQHFDTHIKQLMQGIGQGRKLAIPFFTQVVISSPALLQQAAISYAQAKYPSIASTPITKHAHKKIRLAYFSSDFRQHPVSYLMVGLFEAHDKDRFETFAFSSHVSERKDAMRLRLESAFDQFIDISSQSDTQVLQLARELEIDIAVDLNGFTEGCRPNLFAMRIAPIQVSYIGYLGTMGADYMDYLLADSTLIPESHQVYYQEKIAYLPHSFQVNDNKLAIARKTPSRVSLGLPKKGVVFCCFNNCYKITPEVFASWMRILQAVKDSVLWLLVDNASAKANLQHEAQQHGINAERLVFAQRVAMPDYLARHRLADLFLDTQPYNAGATASAALWAGLPVLTCMGDTFSSRMGASLLNALGLPELITDNLTDYQALAIQLANQPKQLAAIRKKLAKNRLTSPLFDTTLFTRDMEAIYQAMFARYQADLAPEHIRTVGRVSDSASLQTKPNKGIISTLINRFSRVGNAHPTSPRQNVETIEQVDDAPVGQVSDSVTRQTDVDELINQGNNQEDQGLLQDALTSYEQAISINPNYARAYSNRGNVLQTLKRFSEALQSYDQALAIRPDYAEAFYNKGNTLQTINRLEDAIANYQQCLTIKANFAPALIALGAALQSLKRFDEALSNYSQALAITPEHEFLFGDWLYTKINLCDWSDFDNNLNTLARGIEQGKKIALPFPIMVLLPSAQAQKKALQRYSEEKYPSAFLAPALIKHSHQKIKVAYFSSDFRNHPMSFLTAELFEHHDRSQFEVIAISYSPASDKDAMRLKMESLFDQFIDINPYTDEQAVRLCRQLEIDIAVDLNGFTAYSRPQLFAMRVAPLQMSYLGYAGTMGTTYMDYFLADAVLIPSEYQQYYAEKIVYLPNSYMINSRRVVAKKIFTRVELNLPEQGFVFCCFNNTYKITPDVFDVWMRLLQQVQGSVLWLLEDNVSAAKNLRREAIARGINEDSLIFAPRLAMPEHLARQRLGDLFLDTLPCNAHTTTGDALLVDLPVLTCMGETFPSRVAASLLNAIGLPELITHNLADYEALALQLAKHPQQLAALKQKLAVNRVTYPLFDTVLFTRHLENAYQQMYQRYQADLAPDHILVGDAHPTTDNSVDVDELINQGNDQEDQGLLEDALANYEQAISINPNYARAYSNRGNVLQSLQRFQEAIASYDKALALKPDYAEVFYNKGNALQACKQLESAIVCYERALSLKADFVQALIGLGNAQQDCKRPIKALASYDRALMITPDYAEILYNRGNLLKNLSRYEEALTDYEHALVIKPNYAEAMVACALILQEFKRFDEAIAYYDRALATKADVDYALGGSLYLKMNICQWHEVNKEQQQLENAIVKGEKAVVPMAVLSLSASAAIQKKAIERFASDNHAPILSLPALVKHQHAKIKIAYFSSDFGNHPVALLTAELFERHDRTRFEIIAFSLANHKGELRTRLEAAFDQFIDVSLQSDEQVVQLARALEIDIAVDLNGFTGGCRTDIFAMRAAPIQVSYLGYSGTMGIDYIDYLLADSVLIPSEYQRYYAEKIAYLPNSYMVHDSTRVIADKKMTRTEFGLPEQGFVFCCFNNAYKFTPEVFAIWMRILQQVPSSVLWLSENNSEAVRNLQLEANKCGVASERLIFAKRLPSLAEHLARHRLADLFLDTLPYNAHTTSCDALWAGLPVLTCTGETFASRVAASLLTAIGLPELITDNFADYEALAIELATHSEQLAAVKQKLADNRLRYPLFDTVLFTQHIEDVYQQMYLRYQADLVPEHIYVSDVTAVGRISDSVTQQTADDLINQGNAQEDNGQLENALASYEQAISINPNYARAYSNRGNVLQSLQRFQEAIASYDKALALKPDYAEALYNKGNALQATKSSVEAIVCYEQALSLKPDFIQALIGRGNALHDLRRASEALRDYEQALLIYPDYAEAFYNRGNVLIDLKRYDEALASYDRALAINPDYVDVWIGRGVVLQELKRFPEALQSYERAIKLKPDPEYTFGDWLFIKMNVCDWHDLERYSHQLCEGIARGKKMATPFITLSAISSPELQKKVAITHSLENFPSTPLLPVPKKYTHSKIKVGYFSADFYHHATTILMAELFELHDKLRFEIIAFSFSPNNEKTNMRLRLEAAFDQFIDVNQLSDVEIARLARQLEIDIAVDLKGYTKDCRAGIFAMRVAPVQVSYLGYPSTMGTQYIDYLIADSVLIPKQYQHYYTEKIAYLPNSYQVNDRRRLISDKIFSRAEMGLPETGFVFCCFNNSYKIHPNVFDCWMRLLHQVQGSVLWLIEDNTEGANNLRLEANARGISSERLVFAPRVHLSEHLARHCLADLFLDTLPYNAHTTTSDALWAGLPVLTCTGEAFASRVAASLLSAIGLPELITDNFADYEALAIQLATHSEQLTAVKQKLANNRLTYPLFDTALFTKHIEDAYQQMYQRYQADLAPDHILVGYTPVGRVSDSVTRQADVDTLLRDDAEASTDAFPRQSVRTIEIRQADVDDLINQGNDQEDNGQLQEALASYEQAININPNYARAYSNRGNVLRALERFDDALVSYNRALQLKPDYAEAFYNKGNALQDLERSAEALVSYDDALAIKPDLIVALIARSAVLQKLHRFDEALACYDRALSIAPEYAEIYYNRALTLQELRRFDESLASYDRAITIKPDYVSAHWNKSWCLLLVGDFAEGWQEYEWRRQLKSLQGNYRSFSQAMWTGEQALQGKTILIHDEQGLGDTLQFCRYVQQLKALGATVLLEVNPLLKTLLQSLQGVDVLLARGETLPDFDYYCALLSLPLACKTELNSIPDNVPYLFSHKERVEKWQAILGAKTLPCIGLAWSGSSSNPARSIPLSQLAPLFKHSVQFVSLQKELLDRDVDTLASIANLQHYGNQLQDFADTAALCDLMDLVISIDTSVAHLAGAMGKPLWVLLLYNPDWRWLLNRDDNPWYPSARLFRQPVMGDWQAVLERVDNELSSQFKQSDANPTGDNANKFALAMSLHQQQRLNEAAELYQAILTTEPQHIDALHFLGVLKGQFGEAQTAVDLIKQSLALYPDNAAAYSNLALVLQTLSRFDEALSCYDTLLTLTPNDLTALLARSNLLLTLARFDEALASFDKLLAINPNHAAVLFGHANVLYQLKHYEEALDGYNRSLAQNPNSAEALYNRGIVLADLGRVDEAIASYQQALMIRPDYAEVNNNLGSLFKKQERFAEAKVYFQHAVTARPNYADAQCNLINLLREQGEIDQAKACLSTALLAIPDSLELRIIELILSLPMMPKTAAESVLVAEQFDTALTALSAWLAESADRQRCLTQEGLLPLPFLLAYRVGNHKQRLSRYGDLVANTAIRYAAPVAKAKIRMVVISHHFRRHSVWDVVTRGLLANLDRSRFELVLYHLGNIEDSETEFAKALADQWRDTHTYRVVDDWLAVLKTDAPEVIFYPEIGMDPMSARLASYRLAPLQIASWGHPITTGLPTIDLYFSGALLESPEADNHYRERLIRLPNTGCCTTPMNINAEPLAPELLAELKQRGGVRFVVAQTIYKFDPIDDGLYVDIASVVPDSRFILLRDRTNTGVTEQIMARLQQTFIERGLNPEQHLVLIDWQSMECFQSLLDECDIYLDCPSFSGYTTAWQAVHRGIPIITLEGEFMRQRLAAGLLRKIGITDTIVNSRAQYVQCAAQLAQQCRDLARYKIRREAIKNAAPKADNDVSVVRAFEQAILDIIEKHRLNY